MVWSKIPVAASCFVLAAGCASAPPPRPKRPEKKVEQVEPPAPVAVEGAINRAELEVVLKQGPPWLLQRVPIEEVLDAGKFIGWRLRELPVEWDSVDLRAGDVVTAVNAMPLKTPTDFWAAWTTLSVASELKVAYLRDGEALELSIPIYGSPNPGFVGEMQTRPTAAPPPESPLKANQSYAPRKRDQTLIIRSDDPPLTDTLTDYSDP